MLLASALPVLIGISALATDVMTYYYNWFAVQRGVDAAVLSAANYLPNYPSQAISTAQSYATANGIQPTEIASVTTGNANSTISMTANRTVPMYLARIFGISSGNLSASATAQITTVGAVQGLEPLGVDYRTQYTYGQTLYLHHGMIGPGNWGELALGGPGTCIYTDNLQNGYSGIVQTGDWISTETGDDPYNTQSGVNYRINEGLQTDPGGTLANHTLTDPRVFLVPMVDFSGINGNSQVPVKGFAEVWIDGVANDGTITATFIEQTTPSSQPNTAVQGYGAYASILVQ